MDNISIIIPTYNRKILLSETLDNILKQSLPASEIIIVDDHSTDGTLDFLKSRYNGKVIPIINKGKGPGAARNKGLEVATGKYIKFFDSDDLMTNNTLEVQYKALISSGKGFIYSPYFYAAFHNEKGWEQTNDPILNYFPFNESKTLHYWMAVKNLFITIPGMLFKRELLEEVGPWREDVTASEDWDYLWRLSLVEPYPAHTNACAFLYRVHGNQTTESNFSNVQRDMDKVNVMEDILNNAIKDKQISGKERKALENKLFQLYRTHKGTNEELELRFEKYNTFSNKLYWQIFRMDQKLGRVKTGTNWQPCHGPLVSNPKFGEYMKMIE
ncbi:MAG: glycosyltransferase [Cyclobacteriaceae bacterium]|nr:glycosyltransferase [Cyclobacteriaceae bacterium]